MPDNPLIMLGTQEQIMSAVSKVNVVLQELADRDRVNEDDFRYVPGRAAAPVRREQPQGPRVVVESDQERLFRLRY